MSYIKLVQFSKGAFTYDIRFLGRYVKLHLIISDVGRSERIWPQICHFWIFGVPFISKGQIKSEWVYDVIGLVSVFHISNSKFKRISTLKVLKLNISRYRTIWPDFFAYSNFKLKIISTTFWLSFKKSWSGEVKFLKSDARSWGR